MKRLIPLLLLFLVFSPLVSACSSGPGAGETHVYSMAPLHQMPSDVQQAPTSVREAYQFATHNPHVLEQLPCYCGCGPMGHTSNLSCYVSGRDEAGELVYDSHALGCQICVDITQDAMRLLDEGQSVNQIYDYVDATYSRFGPPTPLETAGSGK